jgi:hypothetical protein
VSNVERGVAARRGKRLVAEMQSDLHEAAATLKLELRSDVSQVMPVQIVQAGLFRRRLP